MKKYKIVPTKEQKKIIKYYWEKFTRRNNDKDRKENHEIYMLGM